MDAESIWDGSHRYRKTAGPVDIKRCGLRPDIFVGLRDCGQIVEVVEYPLDMRYSGTGDDGHFLGKASKWYELPDTEPSCPMYVCMIFLFFFIFIFGFVRGDVAPVSDLFSMMVLQL